MRSGPRPRVRWPSPMTTMPRSCAALPAAPWALSTSAASRRAARWATPMRSSAQRARIRFDQEDQNALWLYKGDAKPDRQGFTKILTGPAAPGLSALLPGAGPWHRLSGPDHHRGEGFPAGHCRRQAGLADLPGRHAGQPGHRGSLDLPRASAAGSTSPAFDITYRGLDMTIRIGNAPCSWGVEFASDPRNPPWQRVLEECRAAGYNGHRAWPHRLHAGGSRRAGRGPAEPRPELIGGVVFRPFHDPAKWDEVKDAAVRTCQGADGAWRAAPGADRFDLAAPRADRRTAGEAEQMDTAEWTAFAGALPRHRPHGHRGVWPDRVDPPPCGGLHRLRAGGGAAAGRDRPGPPEDLLRHRPFALCGLRSRGLHEAPHRPHRLYAFQGHRPRGEGRCGRQADGLLRRLRAGHLLQSRQGHDGLPRRAPAAARQPAIRAGARSSRTAIRRDRHRPSTTRAPTATISHPSASTDRTDHEQD